MSWQLSLIVLVVAFSSVTALVMVYPILTGNSAQNQNNASTSLQKQFGLSIAYAYVGEMLTNTSYIGDSGVNISIVSKYASSVILNSTRLPGVQVAFCDAEIEIYNIRITTEKGLAENFCYFIGTNYKSLSSSQLDHLQKSVDIFALPYRYNVVIGDFKYNIKENDTLVSSPIGSSGLYSTLSSGHGLWKDGQPNAISVEVKRIGYLTISNGSVTPHKDALNEAPTVTVNLSNYGNGFLYNNLVPASKLQTIDLLHPISSTS